MSQRANKTLLVIGVLVVVLGIGAWQAYRAIPKPHVREISGATVTAVDATARTATIKFTHPKSGQEMELSGIALPDCRVYVNDRPAELTDVHVGDEVAVRGTVYTFPTVRVEAEWVKVIRHGSATQPAPPATAPAVP